MSRRLKSTARKVVAQNKRENRELKAAIKGSKSRSRSRSTKPPKKKAKFRNRPSQSTSVRRSGKKSIRPKVAGTVSKVVGGPPPGYRGEPMVSKSFDMFVKDETDYYQTLVSPFTCRNVGIPKGNLSSLKLALDTRFTITTDTNGRAFVTFGLGRAIDTLGTAYSLANGCTLIPNTLQMFDTAGVAKKFTNQIGCFNKLGTTVNTSDLFDTTKISNWGYDSFDFTAQDTLWTFVESGRPVSFGISIQPLGQIVDQEGTMVAVQYPRSFFDQAQNLNSFVANDLYNVPDNVVLPMNQLKGFEGFWKPTDESIIDYCPMYSVNSGKFIDIEDDPDAITDQGGFILLFEGCQPNMEIFITVSANLECLTSSTIFMPCVSSCREDTIAYSMAQDYIADVDWFRLTSEFAQTGNMAPARGMSKVNHFVSPTPTYSERHFNKDGSARTFKGVNGTSHYIGAPPMSKLGASEGGGFKKLLSKGGTLLKKLFTEYIPKYGPTLLNVAKMAAPLLL